MATERQRRIAVCSERYYAGFFLRCDRARWPAFFYHALADIERPTDLGLWIVGVKVKSKSRLAANYVNCAKDFNNETEMRLLKGGTGYLILRP